MGARIANMPMFLQVLGIAALAMLVPSVHAINLENFSTARAFGYSGLLLVFLVALIALAIGPRNAEFSQRDQLLTLLATYLVLPVFLAVPMHEAIGNTAFFNTWFEMVSSLTTTGATLFDAGDGRLDASIHLWRALVGWLGGFFIWVTAVALLAPMNLGGFEVTGTAEPGENLTQLARRTRTRHAMDRMGRVAWQMAPVYVGLTGTLWVLLMMAGDDEFLALCHAMSVLATSGISPLGNGSAGTSAGLAGEALILVFLCFGLTRLVLSRDAGFPLARAMTRDPEFRLGLGLALAVTFALFFRHWAGAYEVNEQGNLLAGMRALWGGLFTVLSFLTTTGFVSGYWEAANAWSGLGTPGLILVGLSLIGGGVATTAGGVKLLRVYALYRHGARELSRLVHPNSVAGGGRVARGIRQQGAYIAWIFFMLFAMSLALVIVSLAAFGVRLEDAMVLSIAALSTTGPLAEVASEPAIAYAALGVPAQTILALAMVLGRLETLAIIALFNPDFWRA